MNTPSFRVACLLIAVALSHVAIAETQAQPPKGKNDYHWGRLAETKLSEPFKPEELRALANKPSREQADNRRMMLLLLRAGIAKNHDFVDLLKRADLRKEQNVDLALSGYDFMVNQSDAALDRILTQLATEKTGADVDAIVVLSVLNEWQRSIAAFHKHFRHVDGAGGDAMNGFIAVRAYLYPEKYRQYEADLERPSRKP